MTKLFLLTIAAAITILIVSAVVALVLFRRETRRAAFGRAASGLGEGRERVVR